MLNNALNYNARVIISAVKYYHCIIILLHKNVAGSLLPYETEYFAIRNFRYIY